MSLPSILAALAASVRKLSPFNLYRNPVMFVTEVSAAVATAEAFRGLASGEKSLFLAQVAGWLWLTVLFANFAEALAEGRAKAQAEALRRFRKETKARKLTSRGDLVSVRGESLAKDDVVVVVAGEVIPADGEVIEGSAAVNESAVTGESASVVRRAGGDQSGVTSGTVVLSDRIKIRVTANAGESFMDRMIALVEGGRRQKTANELALGMVLSALTAIFLVVVMTLKPFVRYFGADIPIGELVALLVCLAPTTIGGLLSAIGIAGIDRMAQLNVLAMSGRAVEAAGDLDVVLLDKTGTVTVGDRAASEFIPWRGTTPDELLEAAQLASLADGTPEGRSIVALAERRGLRRRDPREFQDAQFVKFTARTRMSGVDLPGRRIRKGAPASIRAFLAEARAEYPEPVDRIVEAIAGQGATPLLVCDQSRVLGAIRLSDVVKPGLPEKFGELRKMGIKTIMVTGDNVLTATAIGKQANVDEVFADAKPEDKLELILKEQAADRLVGMTGDGTNDAPALAQANIGVVMNSGTQAAKEAGNMIDLDSDPAKLIRIVEIGKQLLMTRGALTTFSIANDVAKYFAILPAVLLAAFPQVGQLDVMKLSTPNNAILSALIFNALVIVALIPLALRGVRYRPIGAAALLRRNLLVFGVGGLVAPFAGIKLIDLVLSKLSLLS